MIKPNQIYVTPSGLFIFEVVGKLYDYEFPSYFKWVVKTLEDDDWVYAMPESEIVNSTYIGEL